MAQAVEDLCVHKKASGLYSKLQALCDEHIKGRLANLQGRAADPVMFLALMDATWQDHCNQMLTIRCVSSSPSCVLVRLGRGE